MVGKLVRKKRVKKVGKKSKTVWKSIKVPEGLHTILKKNAKKKGIAMHKLISELLLGSNEILYYELRKKLTGEAKDVDRAMWYAFKLANGISMFKQAVIISNKIDSAECEQIAKIVDNELNKILRTIEQIEKRCKVELSDLKDAIIAYANGDESIKTYVLNDMVKLAMMKIINSVVK